MAWCCRISFWNMNISYKGNDTPISGKSARSIYTFTLIKTLYKCCVCLFHWCFSQSMIFQSYMRRHIDLQGLTYVGRPRRRHVGFFNVSCKSPTRHHPIDVTVFRENGPPCCAMRFKTCGLRMTLRTTVKFPTTPRWRPPNVVTGPVQEQWCVRTTVHRY